MRRSLILASENGHAGRPESKQIHRQQHGTPAMMKGFL